jgi:hypothetical protein
MPSAAFELQKAVHTALTGDAGVIALVGSKVFDDVEKDYEDFPYITIGEDVLTEFDTDGQQGQVATVTVHTWSRYKGRKEAKQIQSAIYDVLHHGSLSITGFNCILSRQIDETTLLDPDGIARQGIQTFEILIEA